MMPSCPTCPQGCYHCDLGPPCQGIPSRLMLLPAQSAGLVLEGASSQVRFSTNQTDGRREVRVGGSKSSHPINGGKRIEFSSSRARRFRAAFSGGSLLSSVFHLYGGPARSFGVRG